MAKALVDAIEELRVQNENQLVEQKATREAAESLNDKFDILLNRTPTKKQQEEQKRETVVQPTPSSTAGGISIGSGNNVGNAGLLGGLFAGLGIGGGSLLSGLGAAGAGLGAFFLGLSGAEAIMQRFGSGDNLKNLLTNLAEGLSAFGDRELLALGAVLGTGAIFGAVPLISGMGAGIGIGAVGLGLGAFFAGLGAADASMSFLNVDGSRLSSLMKNIAEGLNAFTDRSLGILGGLLAGGALFGAVAGVRRAGVASIGMGMIGLGIGAFFGGLAAGDAAASWMNADGSALKNIMVNLAEGLNAFSGQGLVALGALLGAGALFGPVAGGAGAVGMGLIGAGLGAFLSGFAVMGDVASLVGADGSNARDIMVNIAEGLNAFNGIDGTNLLALVPALAAIGPAMLVFLGSEGIAGIFQTVGDKLKDAWSWLTGSEQGDRQEVNRFQQIADMLQPLSSIDVESLDSLDVISDKLSNFSNAISSMDMVDTRGLRNNLRNVAETIAESLPMLDAMANGGRVGAGLFDGPEMDFGERGQGGILNPSLRLNEVANAVQQVTRISNGGIEASGVESAGISAPREVSPNRSQFTTTLQSPSMAVIAPEQMAALLDYLAANQQPANNGGGGNQTPSLMPVPIPIDPRVDRNW